MKINTRVCLSAAIPLVMGALIAQFAIAPATATDRGPRPATSDGSVTVDGAWMVTSQEQASVWVDGQEVPVIETVLRPADEAQPMSCTINVADAEPGVEVINGARKVSGCSYITVSTGCANGITWTHRLAERQYQNGSLQWVRKGQLYSNVVSPGNTDDDIRYVACGSDAGEGWLNDTNYTSGNSRSVLCHVN